MLLGFKTELKLGDFIPQLELVLIVEKSKTDCCDRKEYFVVKNIPIK